MKIVLNLEKNEELPEKDVDITFFNSTNKLCPICGKILYISGHCKTCMACGWSSCDL